MGAGAGAVGAAAVASPSAGTGRQELGQCLCVCHGVCGVGGAVLGVLVSLYLSWGWGGAWEEAKSSGDITLVPSRALEPLTAAGCLQQAPWLLSPCPGHVLAVGVTPQTSAG